MPMARGYHGPHHLFNKKCSSGGDVPETRITSIAQRSRVALLGIIGADDLLGIEVVDSGGNVVGQLHDILLDLRRNRIAYGVIELRRTRNDGERLVAIPWNALFQDADGDRFTVNAPRERIEEAPLLPSELATKGLDGEVAVFAHSYFGTRPYWEHGAQLC
jgi:sporulation protein YlmC with PRC-barrel domain